MLNFVLAAYMTTKPIKPGTEVDSWCTKCRMDLLHRIIAVHNGRIIRVECRTCGGHHNYRRPKAAGAEPRTQAERETSSSSTERPRQSGAAPSPRRAAAVEAERQREVSWQKAVLGQPVTSFKAYRASQTFSLGDLIRHGKFGDGYIVRVIDRQKVEVMFKDGPRMLAQALEA
jgi:hypothetical protein